MVHHHRARGAVDFLVDLAAGTEDGTRINAESMRAARSLALNSRPAASLQNTLKVGCFDPASMCVTNGRSMSHRPARSSCVNASSRRRAFSTAENARMSTGFRLGRITRDCPKDVISRHVSIDNIRSAHERS